MEKGGECMDGFERAICRFPFVLQQILLSVPLEQKCRVQEIRLRAGQPISLTVGGRRVALSTVCKEEWIGWTFDSVCDHSVYAHEEELRRGFVTTPEGCRIGIAGTAVVRNGCVTTYRDVSALCVRVAREHTGCARDIAERLLVGRQVNSMLLCGEPSCGKTSLLKDLVREFSSAGISAVVIDERGELAGSQKYGADVLLYVPKAVGVEQAVRCLAPQVILLDELGNEEEISAVMEGVYRGVPTVASIHCSSPGQLLRRKALREALENGGFEYLCFLVGHTHPGKIRRVVKTEEWLNEMGRSAFDNVVWRGNRVDEI